MLMRALTMLPPRLRKLLRPVFFTLLVVIVLFFKFPLSLFRQSSSGTPDFSEPISTPVQTTPILSPPQRPPSTPQLGKHRYRPDGLLETNMDGPHPIYELIARAERDWEAKLQRASRTLEEAVEEYKRRYARRPPKGFDLWYAARFSYILSDIVTHRMAGGNMR